MADWTEAEHLEWLANRKNNAKSVLEFLRNVAVLTLFLFAARSIKSPVLYALTLAGWLAICFQVTASFYTFSLRLLTCNPNPPASPSHLYFVAW